MSDKKGGVAIGEYLGIVVFILALVVFGLIFLGCSVSKAKQDYERFLFSKTEINGIRDINFFLEMPYVDKDEEGFEKEHEKKVPDIIRKKHYEVDFSSGDAFDKFVVSHFDKLYGEKWRLAIYPGIGIRGGGAHEYQPQGRPPGNIQYDDKVEGSIVLPVLKEENKKEPYEYEYVDVALQIYE